jgi:hypothetical protein
MKFIIAMLALVAAEDPDCTDEANAAEEFATDECKAACGDDLAATDVEGCPAYDDGTGDDDDDNEPSGDVPEGDAEEAGSAALPIILVLAAIGGLAGAFYCHKTKKACFAPKDGGEGGAKESLI